MISTSFPEPSPIGSYRLYGEGTQIGSVPYVDDVVEGIFCLMKSPETLPMNVGTQIRSTRFARSPRW